MSRSATRTERGALLRIGVALALAFAFTLSTHPAAAQRPNQGEDESAALIDEGRNALKHNKLDDAAKALDQAIALNPRRVDAYVLRSAVYAARKQYARGIELMRKARALAPTDEDVLTALGSQLVLSGDTATGVPLLVEVTAKNPARYDAQLLLGQHYHDTSRWPDAIAAFEAYFQHRPKAIAGEDARHRVDLADSYLRFDKPVKARSEFQRALDDDDTDLRARIGVAWATAAIDCRRARPLLAKLSDALGDAHPEVWLVDGRCALAMGKSAAALELGRKYLGKVPSKAGGKAAAAGHALVGEAYAARGNLAEAKKELAIARELEPKRRRWTVRLAYVLRRGGDAKGALEALEDAGAPERPELDPDWWIELGEALLAKGEAQTAVTRLTPMVRALPDNAAIHTVLGAAQLAVGQPEAAVETLTAAENIASRPRSKRLLVDALATVAATKLAANEAAAAEPLLVRADKLGGNAVVWRDLGIARIALDKAADAIGVLDRAYKADKSPITQMLAARARALSPVGAGAARPIYEKALAGEKGDTAVEIALDWAASEVATGDPAVAVTALERTERYAHGALATRHKAALAIARHAAGLAALKAGAGARAVDLLRASARVESTLDKRCDLALASMVAGEGGAIRALRAVSGKKCPFPPPADTQAAPILVAFTEGLNPRRARRSLAKLAAIPARGGPVATLLQTSIRVVALEAAREAYRVGRYAQARRYLQTARSARARVGTDEILQNLAAVDLAEGKVDAAITQLERLSGKLPEALINLGIAYDKKGQPHKALDAWRRAKRSGARYAPLNRWIESKERIYGK